ncbi:MAG: PadR family transcriptional regulator [Nitrososphaerota archaeon]|nr:PadR family transcriptional regulator [Nitrososphaerota archaeon]
MPKRPAVPHGISRLAILAFMSEAPVTASDLASLIARQTEYRWMPATSTIYDSLEALKKKGLLVEKDGGNARGFAITPRGREEVLSLKDSIDETLLGYVDVMGALMEKLEPERATRARMIRKLLELPDRSVEEVDGLLSKAAVRRAGADQKLFVRLKKIFRL